MTILRFNPGYFVPQTFPLAEFKGALVFLTTAGVIVPLFRRIKLSPVIGFLLAGVVIGPWGIGALATRYPWLSPLHIENSEEISALAELGVVFLLFMIGLELSFERLKRLRMLVFGLGALQVVACAAVLGVIAVFAFGQSRSAALVIGCALALSSTAIVIPTLVERRRLGAPAGRAAFAVLLAQDLMVAPMLFMVSMLGARGGDFGEGLLYAILPAAAAVALIVGAGRLLLRPLFHQVAHAHSTEFFMAACLLVIMGTAILSAMAGLSMALGAFIAGLLLAETEYRREIEVTIEPFKGLLLGLFFVSIGAELDIGQVIASPGMTLALTAGLIVVKAAVIFAVALALRQRVAVAREVALLLAPGGEFAFVMIGAGIAAKVVGDHFGAQVMVAVTLSMVAIPALAAIAARVPVRAATNDSDLADLAPPSDSAGRVIVVGYGRVGKLVGEMLARHDKPFIAIDGSATLVRRERDAQKNLYWGDATRLEFLRKCDLAHASALVVTLDAPHSCERVVELARKERPDITIVARARDAHHATHLYELGATDAIPETVEASLQLSEAVLVDIGVPMGFVIASIHEKRDEYRKLLQGHDDERERRAIRLSTRVKNMNRKRPEKT
jgi:CPA2 family monovalent cation:H+ antiporter-2